MDQVKTEKKRKWNSFSPAMIPCLRLTKMKLHTSPQCAPSVSVVLMVKDTDWKKCWYSLHKGEDPDTHFWFP